MLRRPRAVRRSRQEIAMIPLAAFDAKALQAAVDHAWRDLPPNRRTTQVKELMAEAVMRLANTGERDRVRLKGIALFAALVEPADATLRF